VVIGLSVGLIPLVMRWANWSRSVEPFSVHVLGGMLGVVLTGVMASAQSGNTALIDNAAAKANGLVKLVSESGVWFEQLKAVLVTFLLAGAVSTVIASLLKWIFRAHAEHMLHLAALSSSNEVK
jgi:ammonia channel protein AmtB